MFCHVLRVRVHSVEPPWRHLNLPLALILSLPPSSSGWFYVVISRMPGALENGVVYSEGFSLNASIAAMVRARGGRDKKERAREEAEGTSKGAWECTQGKRC